MPQSYGTKTEIRTPMHTWPTRHPWLACTVACTVPHCFYFFKIPLTISCWHNPVSLGWITASLAWLTPRPAPECVCLWLLDMSTDPPFYPIYSKRVPVDWGWAEDSKYIFIISGKCPSKILEGGSQKVETPLTPPPSRPSRIELIYIPIDSSQSQDSDYKIKNAINSWRPKVTRTGASWTFPKKLRHPWGTHTHPPPRIGPFTYTNRKFLMRGFRISYFYWNLYVPSKSYTNSCLLMQDSFLVT